MSNNFERIWFCGDIHGSYIPIKNFWQRNKDTIDFSPTTDCIILLGDVGANYFLNYRDENFKEKISKYPFTYFCIRGNHEKRASSLYCDNMENWQLEYFFEQYVFMEKKYPNIKYAMDYINFYNIKGYKTLIIPGAYSVDKYYRLKNKMNWFEDEMLSEEEMQNGRILIEAEGWKTDIILSHTCPIMYEPTDLFLPIIDQSTVDKTMERYLGEIEYKIKYKIWLWGHYHQYRKYPVGEDGVQRIMLSAGQEVINLNNINNIY